MKTMRLVGAALSALLLLLGCSGTRIEPYRPNGNGNNNNHNNNPTPVTLTERNDWAVNYAGRTDYLEEDGSTSRVEEFRFTYTGSNLFILRTYSAADFANWFGGDVAAMIRQQAASLRDDAKREGVKVSELSDVYDKTILTLFADIMIHGQYTAYLIELDADGNPTYNYCKKAITIVEDLASDAYTNWLGVWTVTDGYVGYDISVSAIEANHLYRVDGWETGRAAGDVQMNADDDWIEARFLRDETLSFFIQFIAQYNNYEHLGKVDYMFVGSYVESTGEKIDDTEGREIGYAELVTAGQALVKASSTQYTVNGNVYERDFNSMRFSLYSYGDDLWHNFHSVIPEFPMEMIKTKASVGEDRTPVHTENYLRRTQPRMHQAATR